MTSRDGMSLFHVRSTLLKNFFLPYFLYSKGNFSNLTSFADHGLAGAFNLNHLRKTWLLFLTRKYAHKEQSLRLCGMLQNEVLWLLSSSNISYKTRFKRQANALMNP